jgi:hypothetical protein
LSYGLRQPPADPDGPRFPLIRSSARLMSAGATIRARPSEHALSRGSRSATGSSGVNLAIGCHFPANRPFSLVRAVPCAPDGIPGRRIGDGAGDDRVREVIQRLQGTAEVSGKGLGELEFAPP